MAVDLSVPQWLIDETLRMYAAAFKQHAPGACLYCDAMRDLAREPPPAKKRNKRNKQKKRKTRWTAE